MTSKVDDKLISKSKRNKLYNLWITNGIICSIKKKTVYYKQWKKTCSKDNKLGSEDLYKIYKDYRFELRKIIRAAKKEFYHRKFENVKGDMKKTWKLINELRGNNKDKVSTSFVIDGKLVLDHREISNEFNLFFSSIARKMNSKVYSSTLMNSTNEITTHGHRKYFERSVCNSMFFCLEHTKPLFNEHSIFSLENLYKYRCYMETLKIMKLKCPVSLCNLLVPSLRDSNLSLRIPKVRLDLSKNNFVFNACMLWNNFENIVFSRIIPDANGIMVPGSSKNSDLAIPISVAKNRLRTFLLMTQKQGNSIMW